MKWNGNVQVKDIQIYTCRGMVIGRPQPAGNMSVDEMEKLGLVGVYDPDSGDILDPNGRKIGGWTIPKIADADLNTVPRRGLFSYEIRDPEPESTLDDRIKEVKQQKHKNYRARWTGTKYTYEPIDNGS